MTCKVDVCAIETRTKVHSRVKMQADPRPSVVDAQPTCREPQRPVEEGGEEN
jgi:hypothetical protein